MVAAHYSINFTQNATSQGATASSTGLGPASFLLGLPDSLGASLGAIAVNQTVGWYGGYAQDQWQATKKLAITVGLRYDYIAPANYHTIFSGLDVLTGQFVITAPYLPLFPKATGPRGYYYPQYNGFQPRFGIAYQASRKTVLRGAFAIFDDHNNTLVQENQDIHHSWPFSATSSVTNQNRAKPNLFITDLPEPFDILESPRSVCQLRRKSPQQDSLFHGIQWGNRATVDEFSLAECRLRRFAWPPSVHSTRCEYGADPRLRNARVERTAVPSIWRSLQFRHELRTVKLQRAPGKVKEIIVIRTIFPGVLYVVEISRH